MKGRNNRPIKAVISAERFWSHITWYRCHETHVSQGPTFTRSCLFIFIFVRSHYVYGPGWATRPGYFGYHVKMMARKRSESRAFRTLEDYFKVTHGRLEYTSQHNTFQWLWNSLLITVSSQVSTNSCILLLNYVFFLSHNIA